jgi:hypothetical protein
LLRGVKEAAGERLRDINLSHVRYFHELRNKLYHEGNGITIPTDKAKTYAELALKLLLNLLEIDLELEVTQPERMAAERRLWTELRDDVRDRKLRLKEALRQEMDGLDEDLRIAIEQVAPAFVTPRFERWFNESASERVHFEKLLSEAAHRKLDPRGMKTLEESEEELSNGSDPPLKGFRQFKDQPRPELWEFAVERHLSLLDFCLMLITQSFFDFMCAVADSAPLWEDYVSYDYIHAATESILDDNWPSFEENWSLDKLKETLTEVQERGDKALAFVKEKRDELRRGEQMPIAG